MELNFTALLARLELGRKISAQPTPPLHQPRSESSPILIVARKRGIDIALRFHNGIRQVLCIERGFGHSRADMWSSREGGIPEQYDSPEVEAWSLHIVDGLQHWLLR